MPTYKSPLNHSILFRAAGALLPHPPPPPASLLGTRKPHFTLERRHLLEYHINASLPFYNVRGGGSIQSRDLFNISFLLHYSARRPFYNEGEVGNWVSTQSKWTFEQAIVISFLLKYSARRPHSTIMDTKRTRITAYISARLRARLKRG